MQRVVVSRRGRALPRSGDGCHQVSAGLSPLAHLLSVWARSCPTVPLGRSRSPCLRQGCGRLSHSPAPPPSAWDALCSGLVLGQARPAKGRVPMTQSREKRVSTVAGPSQARTPARDALESPTVRGSAKLTPHPRAGSVHSARPRSSGWLTARSLSQQCRVHDTRAGGCPPGNTCRQNPTFKSVQLHLTSSNSTPFVFTKCLLHAEGKTMESRSTGTTFRSWRCF